MAENLHLKLRNAIDSHPGWAGEKGTWGEGSIFGSREEGFVGAKVFVEYIKEKKGNTDRLQLTSREGNPLCMEFLEKVKEKEKDEGGSYTPIRQRIERMLFTDRTMKDDDLIEFARIFDDLKIGEKEGEGEVVTDYLNALNGAYQYQPAAAGETRAAAPPKAGISTNPVKNIQGSTRDASREATEGITAPAIPEGEREGITPTPAPISTEAEKPPEAERPAEEYPAPEAGLPEAKEIPPTPAPTPTEAEKPPEGREEPTPTEKPEILTLRPLVGAIPVEKKKAIPTKKPLIPKAEKFVIPTALGRRKKVKKPITKPPPKEETVAEQRRRLRPREVAAAARPTARPKSGGWRMVKGTAGAAVGGGSLLALIKMGAGGGEEAAAAAVLTMIHFLF